MQKQMQAITIRAQTCEKFGRDFYVVFGGVMVQVFQETSIYFQIE